jgi:hypothetical protein
MINNDGSTSIPKILTRYLDNIIIDVPTIVRTRTEIRKILTIVGRGLKLLPFFSCFGTW